MSWIGGLLVAAMVAVVVLVLRAILQLVFWFLETYIGEPTEAQRRDQRRLASRQERTKGVAKEHPSKTSGGVEVKHAVCRPVPAPQSARRPSRLARRLQGLMATVLGKDYDYWVASALGEEDLAWKVDCLSRALKLNPAYLPAWGMKGGALYDLHRYEEAMACFEKLLEMRASGFAWYKKGQCCYQLGRRQEAVKCFEEAMKACSSEDRRLLEDAARMREQARQE
jgi:tetratricopeptide (TPR) repeat protein